MNYDVIITGAGPAGSVAAIVLARLGVRVLVLDRSSFPRSKLCGDTLNPGALAILEQLGLRHVTAAGLPVDGMIVTGGTSVAITGKYVGVKGRALTRRDLDAALVAEARAAGAVVQEGTLVTGPIVEERGPATVTGVYVRGRDGRPLAINAPIVIAADGRFSRVARAVGLSRYAERPRRWAIGGYFDGVGGLSSFGEMHVRRGHYIGVAPLAAGIANACVVTPARSALGDPATFLQSTLHGDPQLAARFAGARLREPVVSLGPMAVDCAQAGMPGLLLAGDAAGFVDPMTGDGLRFAFAGAEQAAAVARLALEGRVRSPHEELLRIRRRAFTRKWRFNRGLRRLVDSPLAIRAATAGARLAPAVLAEIVRYAGDC